MNWRIGSLCSGYGGLDAAMSQAIGGEVAWVSDVDPGSIATLDHRFPATPNVGDLTRLDWASLPPVDVLGGGIPCQPFSAAGKRKGTADERHLWPYMAAGIAVMRPALVVIENVQGLVTRGLSVVLADLAAMGYDAVWTVIGAADAGAPHRRKRLFVLGVRDGIGDSPGFPVAILDRGEWMTPGAGLFGPVPFAGRIPDHGVMAGGQIHGRPAPVPGAAPVLLPTPVAEDSGNTPEQHLRKKPGRTQVTSLQVIADHGLLETGGMLRTPTAQLAVNGGSQHPDKRKAGGHGPTLADEIEHLPTPNATDGQGGIRAVPERRTSGGPDHGPRPRDVAPTIPTPQATDWKGSGAAQGRIRSSNGRAYGPGDADLPEAVEMLPSPRGANDLDDDGDLEAVVITIAGQRRRDRAGHGQLILPGTTVAPAPRMALLTPTAEAWGKYAPGVARWEAVLGREAPSPTRPGRDGKPRLSPLAVEWLMGLPAGWVCDVPGLTRSQQLKLLGNGVVPLQGVLALSLLLADVLPATTFTEAAAS